MTAKEMFEKLRYEYDEDVNFITCCKFSDENCEFIAFWKKEKEVSKQYVTEFVHSLPCNITLEELQAINKQIEELQWNK